MDVLIILAIFLILATVFLFVQMGKKEKAKQAKIKRKTVYTFKGKTEI